MIQAGTRFAPSILSQMARRQEAGADDIWPMPDLFNIADMCCDRWAVAQPRRCGAKPRAAPSRRAVVRPGGAPNTVILPRAAQVVHAVAGTAARRGDRRAQLGRLEGAQVDERGASGRQRSRRRRERRQRRGRLRAWRAWRTRWARWWMRWQR